MIPSEILERAKKRAQDHMDSQIVASFILVNITHTKFGGYNSRNKSKKLNNYFEYPREQSFKGVWRWWFRAILSATALKDDQIKQKVSEFLGSDDYPAKFKISIVPMNIVSPLSFGLENQDLNEIAKIQSNTKQRLEHFDRKSIPTRLQLSLMDSNLNQQEIEELFSVYQSDKLKLLVQIHSSESSTSDPSLLMIYSFIVAITFSGIGAFARRGFGKFDFEKVIKSPVADDVEITNIIGHIKKSKREQELEIELNRLIQKATNVAERMFGMKNKTQQNIPMHASLYSNDRTSHFILKVVEMKDSHDSKSILYKIGKATLKSEWKKLKYGQKKTSLFHPGGDLDTWILGLPRYDPRFKAGYNQIDGKGNSNPYGRRASAIYLTPYIASDKKWYAIVLGLKSLDWPNIIHTPRSGSRTKERQVYPSDIEFDKVFDEAYTTIIKYLQNRKTDNNYSSYKSGYSKNKGFDNYRFNDRSRRRY